MKTSALCIIILVAVSAQYAESCRCARRHPQTIYNSEDYVLIIEVKKALPGTTSHAEYSVVIREVLKKKADIQVGKTIVLRSFRTCGQNLSINKRYVVSGTITAGKLTLSFCGFTIPIDQFTAERRELFKAYGTQGKTCEIPAIHTGTTPNNKECQIDSNNRIAECQYEQGVCVPERGKCAWRRSGAYLRCIRPL